MNTLNPCPKCGETMTWQMIYISGEPQVYWNCTCGFSSLNIDKKYTVSNKTEMVEGKHICCNKTQFL